MEKKMTYERVCWNCNDISRSYVECGKIIDEKVMVRYVCSECWDRTRRVRMVQ